MPLLALLASTLAPSPAIAVEGSAFRAAVTSSGGVVASESVPAAEAGIAMLDAGGNAIDAAVAAVFAAGVGRPELCGIGGAGFLLYRSGDGRDVAALDFTATWPGSVDPHTYEIPGMHEKGDELNGWSGHMAVGVPGVVAGMSAALDRYGSGKLSLADVIAPAERLAREGVTVTQAMSLLSVLAYERLTYYEETRKVYLVGGAAPYPPGSTLVQEDYGRSLALVARFGPDAFYGRADYPAFDYNGAHYEAGPSIARLIDADMRQAEEAAKRNPVIRARFLREAAEAAAAGNPRPPGEPNDIGLMTPEDLASYRPIWRTPLTGTYRGHHILAVPPSNSGGFQTIEMLNILEGFPLGSPGWEPSSTKHLHAVAEVQKIAQADRRVHGGDPDFVDVPTKQLTSKSYAAKRRAEIEYGDDTAGVYEAGQFAPGPGKGNREIRDKAHTTHVSVIDRDNNAVAVTCTVGELFGSGVVAPGAGFPLNSQVVPAGAPGSNNESRGGKRWDSGTSPTIVVRKGIPVLVTGGGGAETIVRGVVQEIVNLVDFGMDVAHAIDAERVHATVSEEGVPQLLVETPPEWRKPFCPVPGTASCERVSDEVLQALRDWGHIVNETSEYGEFQPVLQSAGVDLETGCRQSVSDPRGETGASGQGATCN